MKKAVIFFRTAIVFVVFFVFTVNLHVSVFAANAIICEGEVTDIEGNACGTLYYVIYNDGTMVITGNGQGASYRPFGLTYDDKCPWNKFREQIKQVRFECTMEGTAFPSIGKGASINGWFVNCINLERVNGIPNGVTDMSAAFLNCSRLTEVGVIPDSVKTMQYTFWNCEKLMFSPNLPPYLEDDMVTEFAGQDLQISQGLLGTFQGCKSLECAPEIPQNAVLYKLTETFKGCTALKTVKEIPQNITYFQATFKNCENLKDVLYIKASSIQLMDGVFYGAARNNPYILFIKTDSSGVSDKILSSIESSSRIYTWDGEFRVNFMVLNSLNNAQYGTTQRILNLRYGTEFTNGVLWDYRSHIVNTYRNYYTREYMELGDFPTPVAAGYVFEGWYYDAQYTRKVQCGQLVNPDNRQLEAHEMVLYAKMRYEGDGCVLTINPNGGVYGGNSGITTVEYFQDKSFSVSYFYTGEQQEYLVPISGNYTMEVYGAQGGQYEYMYGGWGGNISGVARFNKGTRLYIYVGGGGQKSDHRYAAGGYNGGGDSIKGLMRSYYDDDLEEWVTEYDCGAGGGGASDIRKDSADISARIITAGGGGGAALHNYWYCRNDRPDMPNIYTDDDDEDYEVYDRTIAGPNGQGGDSAAGGGGGMRGGAHNYTGEGLYGRINSSYGGTNWYNPSVVNCLTNNYFVWGEDVPSAYGKNGFVKIGYNGKGYTPYEPERSGYRFEGWKIEGDGVMTDGTVFMSEGSTTLTANWTPIDYEIQFEGMGGYVPFTSMKYWNGYAYGQFGDFPAADKTGYYFLGWYTKPEGGEAVTEGKLADTVGTVTLYAHYEARKFMVSFDTCGGSSCAPKMVTWGQHYGSLPVPYREGFLFLGWKYKGESINENTVVSQLENHILTAEWKCMIPPDIEVNGDNDGWRNTPFPVSLDIWDRSDIGLKNISVSVVDTDGSKKSILDENYKKGEVLHKNLSFTIGNAATKEYEGITEWSVVTTDYYDNRSESIFTVKLDFTPPVISMDGTGETAEKEYLDSEYIRQNAADALCGMEKFCLIPASMQYGVWSDELTVRTCESPYAITYNTDRKELKNEAAYILYAFDKAGNRTEKIIFTKISVNNTILRTVPPENYNCR